MHKGPLHFSTKPNRANPRYRPGWTVWVAGLFFLIALLRVAAGAPVGDAALPMSLFCVTSWLNLKTWRLEWKEDE